jgi:signal recognition particle receptor subunit beta
VSQPPADPGTKIVDARIVYWGIEGAGTTTNLRVIHAKLRPDHRGRLEHVPTRLDPSVSYDRLPIELGEIAGVRTRIQIVAVPGGAEHAPTRKGLLDRVDGVVFVVDARRERIDENVAALEELRSALAAYGRSLEEVPLVVQYNKQDLSDAFVLEELHRKLDVRGAAAFEAVAAEGSGVLQTLTTISKRVVRTLRESREAMAAAPPPPAPAPRAVAPPPAPAPVARRAPPIAAPVPRLPDLEAAALAADEFDERDEAVSRAAGLLDASWPDVAAGYPLETDEGLSAPSLGRFGLEITAPHGAPEGDWRIVSAGEPQLAGPRALTIPLVLADADGRELRFRLSLALDLAADD